MPQIVTPSYALSYSPHLLEMLVLLWLVCLEMACQPLSSRAAFKRLRSSVFIFCYRFSVYEHSHIKTHWIQCARACAVFTVWLRRASAKAKSTVKSGTRIVGSGAGADRWSAGRVTLARGAYKGTDIQKNNAQKTIIAEKHADLSWIINKLYANFSENFWKIYWKFMKISWNNHVSVAIVKLLSDKNHTKSRTFHEFFFAFSQMCNEKFWFFSRIVEIRSIRVAALSQSFVSFNLLDTRLRVIYFFIPLYQNMQKNFGVKNFP